MDKKDKLRPIIEVIDNSDGKSLYILPVAENKFNRSITMNPIADYGTYTIVLSGVDWSTVEEVSPVIIHKRGRMTAPSCIIGSTYIYCGIPKGLIDFSFEDKSKTQ